MTKVCIFLITVALIAGMVGCDYTPSQNLEIRTWYDLDDVRNNLGGHHILMKDLDYTTPGYTELASPTANGKKGWQPIGTCLPPSNFRGLTGTFDGQGYEIRDLFINRPDEDLVGLFGVVYVGGIAKDIGLVNATVTGNSLVGGLVGVNVDGTLSNSYSSGNVTGEGHVGGLVGDNQGIVSNSYSSGNVNGEGCVGGLAGYSAGTVSNSYSTGSVIGDEGVGGLVGWNYGTVGNSYSTGSVTGDVGVGGLVGENLLEGTVSNSYSTGNVSGNEDVGGLVGANIMGVIISFWDIEISGQPTSAGGTGKTTAEMIDITTFSGVGWNVIAVSNPSTRNPSYIWNIVNGVTYPFLSWQS